MPCCDDNKDKDRNKDSKDKDKDRNKDSKDKDKDRNKGKNW
jgi:hypothetical protein